MRPRDTVRGPGNTVSSNRGHHAGAACIRDIWLLEHGKLIGPIAFFLTVWQAPKEAASVAMAWRLSDRLMAGYERIACARDGTAC